MAQKADSLTWWDWVAKVQNEEDIKEEHIHRCYRLVGGHAGTCAYKCSVNCRRNPKCYWGLGEKQWITPQEDSKEEKGQAEKRQIVKGMYDQLLPITEESESEDTPYPVEEYVVVHGNGIHAKGEDGNAKGSSKKDKETSKKNMDEIVRRKAQIFNKKYSVDKLLFISATSFSTWLRDTESLEIPMDNQEILCQHNKLRPPSSCVLSQSTLAIKYKAIPYSVYEEANQQFSQNKEESSALLHGRNAFCEICVRAEFRTIKKFTLLEQRIEIYCDEYDETQEKIENFSKRSADLDHQDSFWENKMWISIASHRKWKNWVKSRFDPEKLVDSGAPANVNKDIECEHGYLNLAESRREVISVKAWTILLEYFPGSTQFPVRHSERCEICRNEMQNEMQNELIRIRDKKKVAAELSETFHDLRKGINRPKHTIAGTYYYVSEQFFQKFLTFLRSPAKHEIPDVMDNSDLVCEHNKFKYPYELHENIGVEYEKVNRQKVQVTALSRLPFYDPPWELLNDNEWAAFMSLNFPYNQVVSVTVENDMKLTYEPDQCYTCALAWSEEILEERYCMNGQPVFLRSLEPEKEVKSDVYIVEDDDDDKDDFVPHKRGINRKRPVSPQHRPEINDGSVRRSSPSEVANQDKRVLCNSTDTVHQLKKLVRELNYTKCASDIALFVDDRCLSDSTLTLREYKIHPHCIVLYANGMQNGLIRIQEKKKVAAELSETFHDLRKGINRPKPTMAGTYYYVSEQFFQKLWVFISSPAKHEIPDVMDNSDLVCEHNKFKYPYELHESLVLQYEYVKQFLGLAEYNPPWQLLNSNEWAAFRSLNFPYNQVVSVTVENGGNLRKLTYEPDHCCPCAIAFNEEFFKDLYSFKKQPVFT